MFFCVVVAAVGRGDYTGTKQGSKFGSVEGAVRVG